MSFLARWDPWRELERWSRAIDESPRGGSLMTLADWAPRVDIQETQEEFLVHAELPGVKKEDVKLTVKDGTLTIQGERNQAKEERGSRFHRTERQYGSFMRSFSLPEGVLEDKLGATYKDGMLTVHLPKSQEPKAKPVEIKIH